MTDKDCKALLHACRKDLWDVDDPEIQQAIKLLESDPRIQEWLEKEQAFDKAFCAALKGIAPPEGLRERILDGRPGSADADGTDGSADARRTIWCRHPVTWSMAACFLVLLAIGTLISDRRNAGSAPETVILADFGQFVDAVVNHERQFDGRLDYKDSDIGKIRTFLASNKAPAPSEMKGAMKLLSGIGCKSFTWEGQQVGMMCLRGDKIYHLYTTKSDSIAPSKRAPIPLYRQVGSHAAAAWRDDDKLHVLIVEGDEEDLRTLL